MWVGPGLEDFILSLPVRPLMIGATRLRVRRSEVSDNALALAGVVITVLLVVLMVLLMMRLV